MQRLPQNAANNINRNEVIDIQLIRRDGGTQGRTTLNQSIIVEYAELMKAGVVFPPVRLWFDGENYWLSDGFQRTAAAELAGQTQIVAAIFTGNVEDAQWDSFGANATHGARRTRCDIDSVIVRALGHVNASRLSNNQIAHHLGVPEATLRRWKKSVSSPRGEDRIKVAVRKGMLYKMNTADIGRRSIRPARSGNTCPRLRSELEEMKLSASTDARRLLNVIGHWMFDQATLKVCVSAIESIIRDCSSAREPGPKIGCTGS